MNNFDLTNYLSKNRLTEAIELISLYPKNPKKVAQKVADHFTETDDLGLIYSIQPGSLKMDSRGAYFDLDTKAGPNTPGEDWEDINGFGIENYLGDFAGGSFIIRSEEGLDEDFFVIRNLANKSAKVGSVTPEGEVIFSTQEDNLEEKETKSNKMTKAKLKEMIRQNILNELAEEITEDSDMEFGDPDVGLSKLYSDFYEGLEEQEEEVKDVEKVDVNIDEPAAPAAEEPTLTDTEKEIQGHLDQALQAAQEIGNEKLIQQIGNTITFFTRDFVVKEAEGDLVKNIGKGLEYEATEEMIRDYASGLFGDTYEAEELADFYLNNPNAFPKSLDYNFFKSNYDDILSLAMTGLGEGKKEYYKDAEADDAEHIKALEKDMEDDKKSSMNESMFPLFKKIIK